MFMVVDEQRQTALEMIATGSGMAETAKALGVRLATLWAWRNEPEFQVALSRHQRNALEWSEDLLVGQLGAAHRVLRKTLTGDFSEAENGSCQHQALRLKAAIWTIEWAHREGREDSEADIKQAIADAGRHVLEGMAQLSDDEIAARVRKLLGTYDS